MLSEKPLDCSKYLVSNKKVFLFVISISRRGYSSEIGSPYFLRPSKVTEHVASRVSVGEFKIK